MHFKLGEMHTWLLEIMYLVHIWEVGLYACVKMEKFNCIGERMYAFKRRLRFSFTVLILA